MKTITLNNGQTTELGTVICGTMRNEEVIPALVSQIVALCDDEELSDLSEQLFDMLSSLCPDGYYFGAHIGDGSDYGFWQDETQITQDKDGNTIVNPDDREWHDQLYLVVLDSYAPSHYAVWADNESDALDYVVDYCEDKGHIGYFLDESDIDEDTNVYHAGNHSLALDGDSLQVNITKLA